MGPAAGFSAGLFQVLFELIGESAQGVFHFQVTLAHAAAGVGEAGAATVFAAGAESTSGERKQRFMVSTSSQARR